MTAERYIGASGIAAVLLFVGGNALWAFDQPTSGTPPEELVEFYADSSGRIVAGALMSLLAAAVFMFFLSGFRELLSRVEGGQILSTTAFAGALLGIASGLGAETINMVGALRADDGELSPALAQAVFEISWVLGFNGAGVGLGVFVLATAAIALQRGTLFPRWLAWLLLLGGLTLVTPLSQFTLGPAVLLFGLAAVYLLRSNRKGSLAL